MISNVANTIRRKAKALAPSTYKAYSVFAKAYSPQYQQSETTLVIERDRALDYEAESSTKIIGFKIQVDGQWGGEKGWKPLLSNLRLLGAEWGRHDDGTEENPLYWDERTRAIYVPQKWTGREYRNAAIMIQLALDHCAYKYSE